MLQKVGGFFSKTGKLPWLIIAATFILVFIFKMIQPEPPVKPLEEKTWLVQITVLSNAPQSPQLKLYGIVESPYTATIKSSVAADVLNLTMLEGQSFVEGERLLELDISDADLELKQHQANLAELEASILSEKNRYKNDISSLKIEKSLVSLAEKKLSREEKTSKSNLTSLSSRDTQKQALYNQRLSLQTRQLNIDDHPARLAQLKAKHQRAKALVSLSENALKRAGVLAPYDGVVIKTQVSPGERVSNGQALLIIYATDQTEIRAQLPNNYIAGIKQALNGEAIFATIPSSKGHQKAELTRLSGQLADSGSGIDALFVFDEKESSQWNIGDALELLLTLPALESVYSVPVSSIYGTNRIYRVEENRLVAISVSIVGNRYIGDKQQVLIKSKLLKSGDSIITTQLPNAINGLKVNASNSQKTALPDSTL